MLMSWSGELLGELKVNSRSIGGFGGKGSVWVYKWVGIGIGSRELVMEDGGKVTEMSMCSLQIPLQE